MSTHFLYYSSTRIFHPIINVLSQPPPPPMFSVHFRWAIKKWSKNTLCFPCGRRIKISQQLKARLLLKWCISQVWDGLTPCCSFFIIQASNNVAQGSDFTPTSRQQVLSWRKDFSEDNVFQHPSLYWAVPENWLSKNTWPGLMLQMQGFERIPFSSSFFPVLSSL